MSVELAMHVGLLALASCPNQSIPHSPGRSTPPTPLTTRTVQAFPLLTPHLKPNEELEQDMRQARRMRASNACHVHVMCTVVLGYLMTFARFPKSLVSGCRLSDALRRPIQLSR